MLLNGSYTSLLICSLIAFILTLAGLWYIYRRLTKWMKSKDYQQSYNVELAILAMVAMAFALGIFFSTILNSYTKMIILTSINENHLVV